MTMTPDFPDDFGELDFELPDDFIVPDDLSELDTAPPPISHETTGGQIIIDDDDAALPDFDVSQFDSELAAMTGEQPEIAIVVTPVADARALAGICALGEIVAESVPSESGALAVLSDVAGEAPRRAAGVIAHWIKPFGVLLVTKAAGQLTAHRFDEGHPPEEVPGGLVVAGASAVLEDLLVGAVKANEIPGTVSSVGISRAKAMLWMSGGARKGRRKQ